ncbi:M20/M25/M40 family metallo-hydrolase [Halalkalicoccus sp. NIPERK01]|uniref:M20/M25/M40 family metallo-hydrolase n=1 Tax=Halalkalicoccus sp. NIPERK01 TaxID=3053469 RepID=UPI00256F0CA9|nr:M20/M25/M40 family metallo-hydrolase [Halalkalicoccus sp. NIPERK01]MDL5361303.1 M20/M25/M40 family metallo-hydrolase [Halalkalicoccus sp. NIPERK01]
MDDRQRAFLDDLLATPSPSGFETEGQRVWIDAVSEVADEVRTDAYGNAVAVIEGGPTEIAVVGHADQIGYIVRRIDDDGYLHLGPIGGVDRTVSRGQYVTVHADSGTVPGVIGQTAIHLREGDEEYDEIRDQKVDIGAADGEAARELVSVGDPITVESRVSDLQGSRLAASGLDNRVGTWTAAEVLRAVTDADVEPTVYAVSTIQEELGVRGAEMVGFDLSPDAAIAVDVTHASDGADAPADRGGDIDLGAGPVIGRGSANHPALVDALRAAASEAGIGVQLEALGTATGTDADAFYTARGGIPSVNLGIPNRYMHTPVEVIDTADLLDSVALLSAFLGRTAGDEGFGVEV